MFGLFIVVVVEYTVVFLRNVDLVKKRAIEQYLF